MNTRRPYFLFILSALLVLAGLVQVTAQNEADYDSIYAKRILLEEIDGVYIPRDLTDAFAELKRLSSPAGLLKFQHATEDVARNKLHFGLGKWMIVNWGFYEGSRFSYFLSNAGLKHPDDMAKVTLVCFHRYLNQKPLQFEAEVAYYQEYREKERLERELQKTIISEETHPKKD